MKKEKIFKINSKKLFWIIQYSIWTIFFIFNMRIVHKASFDRYSGDNTALYLGTVYFLVFSYTGLLLTIVIRSFYKRFGNNISNLFSYILISFLLSFILANIWFIEILVFDKIVVSFGYAVSAITFRYYMWEVSQGTIIFFAWSSTYMFIKQWIISLENKTNLESAILRAENSQLKFLQHQLNPHFLFNSLNVLSTIISDKNTTAKEFVRNFSKIYRYVLEKGDCDIVPISDEIDFIESYLFLIQKRHHGKIFYSIDELDINGTFILPMALQLLVENAIKHNAATTEQPLRINIYRENEFIVVSNNINPKNCSEGSTQLGLNNLSERYKYLISSAIKVKETDKYFEVKLPIINIKGR